jgi:hypothetical protein
MNSPKGGKPLIASIARAKRLPVAGITRSSPEMAARSVVR